MNPPHAALCTLTAQTHRNHRLFPIREGRKFGFINRTGSVVVPPQYDAVGEPNEGRINITLGSLSGKVVIPR